MFLYRSGRAAVGAPASRYRTALPALILIASASLVATTSDRYHPQYWQRIREVMKYSGRKLVLSGRLDYLYHLLF
jgi:hypothetical protein